MIRRLGAALFALLLTVHAFAQTSNIEMPAPQTTPFSEYVTGWDDSGFITSKQVDFSDLSFFGVFGAQTTSNTEATIALGNVVLYLNDTTGFAVDYTIQVRSQQDPQGYFYGIITALDTGSGAATIAVTVAPAFATFQNWTVQVIAGPTFGLPASSASGVIADSFAVPAQGDSLSVTTDLGKAYLPGASVYVQAIADYTAYFIANVVSYDPTTGAIVLFAQQVGGSGTQSPWTISMVDTAGATVTTVSYSSTSLQFGATHDIFVGATVSVTTGADKLFTSGSHIILNSTTDSTQYFRMISQAYNVSTGVLSGFVTDVGPTATGTVAAWSLFAQDGPAANAPGTGTSSSTITVPGFTAQRTLTTQSGKAWQTGSYVLVSSASDSAVNFAGVVVSYSATTLVVQSHTQNGSTGTSASDWIIVGNGAQLWSVNETYTDNINLDFSSTIPQLGNYSWVGSSNSNTAFQALDNSNLTAQRQITWKFPNAATSITFTGSFSGSGTNTGDQTITLTGDVTGSGTGSFATTIKNSVALAGSPTTTTQSANDNSTKIATTAYFDKCHATVASGSFPSATNLTVAIPAGCSNIQISWSGVKFDTASRGLEIQVSTDNGSTYDTTATNYLAGYTRYDAGTVVAGASATMVEVLALTTAQTITGSVVISGYATAGNKAFNGMYTSTVPQTRSVAGTYIVAAAVTNIKYLLNGTGNFNGGTYVVSVDYLFLPLGLFGIGRRRKPANDNGLAQKYAA